MPWLLKSKILRKGVASLSNILTPSVSYIYISVILAIAYGSLVLDTFIHIAQGLIISANDPMFPRTQLDICSQGYADGVILINMLLSLHFP